MNNTPDSPAKPPDDCTYQGGNYWTLFTPGIWKVLHAVLHVIDAIAPQLGLVRTLRGLTPTLGSLDEEEFSELRIEGRFADNPDLARAECWYWIRKLQARFFAGYYSSAIEASSRAQRLLETSLTVFEAVEYHF